MSLTPFRLSLALAATVLALPAQAQMEHSHDPAQCATTADLPTPLASWRSPVPLRAAANDQTLASAVLKPGQSVTLALQPSASIAYPVRPEKPGEVGNFGGLARFTVTEAGVWRIALGSGAWVDVVKDGKALPSINHGHGPECSGIRKMVDFQLNPGDYTLLIAASGSAEIKALATRLP